VRRPLRRCRRDRRCRRSRRRRAEVAGVDPVVAAIAADRGQAAVELGEQIGVALPDGDAVVLGDERRVVDGLELAAGVVLDVVDDDAVVGDDRVDAAGLELLQRQRRRLEALDVGAVLALQLRNRLVAGGAGLHADLERLQVGEAGDLRVGLGRDQLVRIEVRIAEIHRLPALVGDRD
jgi:hypothetical protein